MRTRPSNDKLSLSPEMVPLYRALEPHADTIRKWLWVFNAIVWAAAIAGWVGVWLSLSEALS